MSDRTPGGADQVIAPYASPGTAGRPDGGAPGDPEAVGQLEGPDALTECRFESCQPPFDSHLRYDDSRPRGLASECICGEPGCTRWYQPFWEDL